TYWYTGLFDNGGVHINSGVQNKWFYLLSAGGSGINDHGRSYTVQGIGIEKAADIAFRNLTVYLSPFSEYREAREGAILAATDLFGENSQEVLSTIAAWEAVGVAENNDPYCRARGTNASQEWIAAVEMGSFINNSIGAGYSNFSDKVINVQGGRNQVISLTPGYRNRQTHAWWAIWIDYNGDGDFYDANEEVFVSDTLYAGPINREIFIRNGAVSPARMRIAMKWSGQAPTPCEIFPFGEVEDYSIAFDGVGPPATCNIPAGLNARSVTIDGATLAWSAVSGVSQYRLKYRVVGTSNWNFRNVQGLSVNLSGLSENTSYEAQISSFCGGIYSDYSASVNFTTTSCDQIVSSSNFESGWGIWNDGGSDAQREFNPSKAIGNYVVRLRDNSNSSVILSDPIDLSTYASVEVSFTYLTQSFDNSGEDFVLEISNDLQSYTTVENWTYGIDFENNQRGYARAKIDGPFARNARLRIRCDASANDDLLYLDDIVIATCSGAGNPPPPPPVCNVPSNLISSNITQNSATIIWSADANSYNLRFRKVGQTAWTSRNTSSTIFSLTGLEGGTNYEVQVRAVC
ncbi:MAG: M4 family metallopeptidase, partial [Bacteroidota bacterium]